MKKLWMLLALLLALGMTGAWAEEADEPIVYTSGEWEYVLLEDGTAEIADYHGETEELTIPAEIKCLLFFYFGTTQIHAQDFRML